MRFRLPKHGTGWREFSAEVGIVVLGVLIALGAEQLVSDYLQRQEAEYTEAALKDELRQAAGWSIERLAVEDCLRQRIAHLDAKLQREGEHWTADPLILGPNPFSETTLATVYRPMRRPWTSDVWQMAISSGIIRHIPRERLMAYSGVYHVARRLRETNDREYATIARLGPLRADRRLDPHFAIEASVALAELDFANTAMVGGARQFLTGLKKMRLGYTAEEMDASDLFAGARRVRGGCVKEIKVTF